MWASWIDRFNDSLETLVFSEPVTHVYNPLQYARDAHLQYLDRFAGKPKEIVLLGMNPGPWGMVQTGVPFGEVNAVRDWLKITGAVGRPEREHPNRPVDGLACRRSEVSGRRLWGWARGRFQTVGAFFERFFVSNYCPLSFMASSGKNITPNALGRAEKEPLLRICDQALIEAVERLKPKIVIGVGQFAAQRAAIASQRCGCAFGQITHPSPANPKANRGWVPILERELENMGVEVS